MSTFATVSRRLARGRTRRYLAIAGTVLGVVAFLAFAPAALGGSSTYVTTYGSSMEPTLTSGDLVVVRPQDSYNVGDVVAYRSDSLGGTVVLHRIIDREGDRYVFKGDNNTWIDDDRPTEDQLIGRMDTHVDGMGDRLQQVQSPVGLSVLVGVAIVPSAARKRRRGRGKGRGSGKDVERAPRRRPSVHHVDPRLLAATGVVLLVAGFAFTRPTAVESTSDVPFDDRGEFSYSGAAPGSAAVYPTEVVTSGQPVFLNLVDEVEVGFRYEVSSTAPVDVDGSVALRAELADSSGWSYPFELAPPVQLRGGAAEVSGTLDLVDVRARIDAMEAATGAARDAYTVRVVADVERAVASGDTVSAGTFDPALEFQLEELEMRLAVPSEESLRPTEGGLLTTVVQRPGEVKLLGKSMSTGMLRGGAVGTLILLAALVGEAVLGSSRHGDEARLIQRRYRNYLLPLRSMELSESTIVDVESIAALARVADHTSGPILSAGPGSDSYYVVDGPRVFRYRTSPAIGAVDVAAVDVEAVEEVAPADTEPARPTPPRPARTRPLRVRVR